MRALLLFHHSYKYTKVCGIEFDLLFTIFLQYHLSLSLSLYYYFPIFLLNDARVDEHYKFTISNSLKLRKGLKDCFKQNCVSCVAGLTLLIKESSMNA